MRTPPAPTGGSVIVLIEIPKGEHYFSLLLGAVCSLTDTRYWEQVPGNLTVTETVQMWIDVIAGVNYEET